jgi:uncharacterized protein YdiU (UPF0061 family)
MRRMSLQVFFCRFVGPSVKAMRPSTRHAELGPAFYDIVAPAQFPAHVLRYRNQVWARRVGLGGLTDDAWIEHFGRFTPLPGSFPQPLALRYHGHQFRTYNPELGDGRGFLFAQLHDLADGRLLDLGTKGSGTTPWSRRGDGRLTLKGGVREVLATAMLEALGVDTSKTFSLIETGEALERNDEPSPTRSSVLVRLSHTHIRIGSFQRLAYLQDHAALARLLDHAIEVAMPDAWRDDPGERACTFLREVCRRVARTGAQWMAGGFVHGVLNTDNINITGESFDYGPWRFLPVFDQQFTAAYFDYSGLYAYGRQPETLLWNLVRLAECLLPFAGREALEEAVSEFVPSFRAALPLEVVRRLGLSTRGAEADAALAACVWAFLQSSQAPFEQFFFDFHGGVAGADRMARSPSRALYTGDAFAALHDLLGGYGVSPAARLDHAYFRRPSPCTMLIEDVERIWSAIAEADDWSVFYRKLADIGEMAEAYETGAAGGG